MSAVSTEARPRIADKFDYIAERTIPSEIKGILTTCVHADKKSQQASLYKLHSQRVRADGTIYMNMSEYEDQGKTC